MIRRLARQATQLLGDKQLRPYWSSRGLIASLFFLFGILLRESGYQATEVLGAWVVVYLAQATLLLSLDRLIKRASARRHQAVIVSCALGACASTLGMVILGTHLALLSITTILLLPVLREAIHNGTLYIRGQTWEFGPNLASLLANETGKAIGALLIFLFGYLSSIDDQWMAGFLLVLILVSIRSHTASQSATPDHATPGDIDIGPLGRGFVMIASLHNGAFMAVKAVLSLIVFDMLATETDLDNIITTLAAAVSVALLGGMVLFQVMQAHIEPVLKRLYRDGLFTLSLGVLTGLSLASASAVLLFQLGVLSATLAAYSLAVLIALFMAIGSLFSLGSLQFLDNAFGLHETTSLGIKKAAMHRAWIGSSFAPSAFLLLYLGLLSYCDSLLAGLITLGVIALAEVVATAMSIRLHRRIAHHRDGSAPETERP